MGKTPLRREVNLKGELSSRLCGVLESIVHVNPNGRRG